MKKKKSPRIPNFPIQQLKFFCKYVTIFILSNYVRWSERTTVINCVNCDQWSQVFSTGSNLILFLKYALEGTYGGPIGEVFRKFRCLRTKIYLVRENIFAVRRKVFLPKYIYHMCQKINIWVRKYLFDCPEILWLAQKSLGLRKNI